MPEANNQVAQKRLSITTIPPVQLPLKLVTFEYQNKLKVRIFGSADDPVFALHDVCMALGLPLTNQITDDMDAEDMVNHNDVDSKGTKQPIACVTEAGLFHLIFKSTRADAQMFKRWVMKEVLPQLRKTGTYSTRKGLPVFVRRFNDNWHRVENGYFSVISELYIRVHGKFEQYGYQIADNAPDGREIRPDVSVGQHFAKYLKLYHADKVSKRKKYFHVFANKQEVEAWQYPLELLPTFIEFVETIWLKEHAAEYLKKRDENALPYLGRILPALKPAVRIAPLTN